MTPRATIDHASTAMRRAPDERADRDRFFEAREAAYDGGDAVRAPAKGIAAPIDSTERDVPSAPTERALRAVDEELAHLLERTAEQAEVRRRSARANVLVTVAASLVAIGPLVPGGATILGVATPAEASAVAAAAWCVYELATIAFHVLGARHALTVLLSGLDALAWYATPLALIYLSGSASSPLWIVLMVNAFVWTAKPPRQAKLELALPLVTHLALAIVFLLERRAGDASLTVLVLLASMAGHTATARLAARSARVRADRDVIERRLREASLRRDRERLARELHDGLGADVMALTLQLRLAAEGGADPRATRLAKRAEVLLDELRAAVWSLRNAQGTLAELGKLIDATCKGVLGGVAYERKTPIAIGQARIGPTASLAALTVARDLARDAAARPGVRKVTLTLTVTTALELTVEDDGFALTSQALEEERASLGSSVHAARKAARKIEVSNLPGGAGVRVHATIAPDRAATDAAG